MKIHEHRYGAYVRERLYIHFPNKKGIVFCIILKISDMYLNDHLSKKDKKETRHTRRFYIENKEEAISIVNTLNEKIK